MRYGVVLCASAGGVGLGVGAGLGAAFACGFWGLAGPTGALDAGLGGLGAEADALGRAVGLVDTGLLTLLRLERDFALRNVPFSLKKGVSSGLPLLSLLIPDAAARWRCGGAEEAGATRPAEAFSRCPGQVRRK